MITRQELKQELRRFLEQFEAVLQRIYGCDEDVDEPSYILALPKEENTEIWKATMAMYDYGVLGKTWSGLDLIVFEYVGQFLVGLEDLQGWLGESNCPVPRNAIHVVRIASARYVLEGGERPKTLEQDEALAGFLTLQELSWLADMDIKSVRNTAAKGAKDRLSTQSVGNRPVVSVQDARPWLRGRKSFKEQTQAAPSEPSDLDLELSKDSLERLRSEASTKGMDLNELVGSLLKGNNS